MIMDHSQPEHDLEPSEHAKSTLWESVGILLKWRNFIGVNIIVVALLSAGISFLFPKWYKATASILPPKQRDLFGAMGSAGSLLKGLTGKGFGEGQDTYNYFAILNSRTAMDSVVQKFDLIDVYNIADRSLELAVKELQGNARFEVGDNDEITIEVLDRDPRRAAEMTNYFIALLNRMSIELTTREARNNREFIEGRVEATQRDLHSAEDSLQHFQERSGMIVVPEGAGSGISTIANLYGLKARKEVELSILQRTVEPGSASMKQAEVELEALNRRLSSMPQLGMESLRLYRSVAIQQKILEYLMPMFEQAKVDEQKDVPVLLVLDKAVVPERKTKPQRLLIVTLAVSLTALLSTLLVFVFQGLIRSDSPMNEVQRRCRSWVNRLRNIYKVDS